jgi:DnaK suppressor protein
VDESDAAGVLEVTRASLADRITRLVDDLARLAAASAGGNVDDEHDPEGATLAFERAQSAASLQRLRALQVEVDDALRRIALHCYGRCEQCGARIDRERLIAIPVARRCIGCATL